MCLATLTSHSFRPLDSLSAHLVSYHSLYKLLRRHVLPLQNGQRLASVRVGHAGEPAQQALEILVGKGEGGRNMNALLTMRRTVLVRAVRP